MLVAVIVLLATLVAAPRAHGSYHLTKIREISGDPGSQQNSYIELQMYADGQNLVSGHDLTFWDADGLVLGMPVPVQTITLSGPNPPNPEAQRTILIGDSAVAGRDFTVDLTPLLDATAGNNLVPAGAACFEAIPVDCVSWGGPAFTGAANLPDNATPFGTALPTATALRRDISRGCATALDVSDDTNDNAADFANVARDPTPNSATPIEQSCGPGGGGGQNVFCGGKRPTRVGSKRANVLVGTGGQDVIAGLGATTPSAASPGTMSSAGARARTS